MRIEPLPTLSIAKKEKFNETTLKITRKVAIIVAFVSTFIFFFKILFF